jgi:ubiquinone/menaquinone biosynthesis C-methylase UbiE
MEATLTDRQKREVEYHRQHAEEHARVLSQPFSWSVLERPSTRWWNAYWSMYADVIEAKLEGKRVLVVGCGFGDDALRLAKLRADVYAFDLSPESLILAKALAKREGLHINFDQMPAEALSYPDNFFDCVVARDILHHVDIPRSLSEIRRVAKDGALFIANEIYSHSITDRVRRSRFVERWLYPAMQSFVYGPGKPYITEDERKLTERDLKEVLQVLSSVDREKHFNFVVTRVVPDRFSTLAKLDRLFLKCAKPIGRLIAGRILLVGRVGK